MKSIILILLIALSFEVTILNKKKVLIATEKPFTKVAINGIIKILEDAHYDYVVLENYKSKNDLIKAVIDVDAMIIRSDIIDKQIMDAAKKLKIIVRAGAGFDNVDLNEATAHGIVVMNTPGQNANAVAELALGLMVYSVRNFYNGKSGSELKGKKLGIHAYGNVGKNVARIATGFGMECYAFDAYIPKDVIENDGVKAVDNIEDLYKNCDIVSLHIPATKETKNSINYDLVNMMPKGGILVNTARKEVIDEDGLIKLMKDRQDIKYVTDIAPKKINEFNSFKDRFFATPKKMGAQTTEANTNAGLAAANQIIDFFVNGNVKFQVNK